MPFRDSGAGRGTDAIPVAGPAGERVFAKVSWRLLPLLLTCYVIAFIDRVNISYAQLGMKRTLDFTNEAYAIGAGAFFVGYLLFEVPSNMLLERIGVRKTLLRIMLCWGLVSAAMAFVGSEAQLYALRFLLGVFEAGFFPGVVLYLTYWYPADRRGGVFATLTTAVVVAPILAGPLSGAILKYADGGLELHGWQWLFILQGLPACLFGVFAFLGLTDRPDDAAWLSAEEKGYLRRRLEPKDAGAPQARGALFRRLLTNPRTYLMAAATILFSGASYATLFAMPSLIAGWGIRDPLHVGFYAIAPSSAAFAGMLLIGRSSDKRGDRRWHFAGAGAIAAVGLVVVALSRGNLALSLGGLCLWGFGQAGLLPIYTAIISAYVPRAIAAAGIALMSCIGHLGSALTPPAIARIDSVSGGAMAGLLVVACLYLCSALSMLLALRTRRHGGLRTT